MAYLEFPLIFMLGGLGYGGLEILWRGHTHWTMLLLGGACLCLIYLIATRSRDRAWKKWIMCACCITALEFVIGCIVNIRLGWAVWDYSDQPMNLMGQICPLFSFFWLLLSIPCVYLSGLLHRSILPPLLKGGCRERDRGDS